MISAIIIAWNEEENLPKVVGSVKTLVDEVVVVVDQASTDQTLAIAKRLKCKVFTHAHTGIVEPMRNFAITKAKGDWILLLDADEQITPELAEHVKKITSDNKYDFVKIPRKNMIFSKWIKSDHWWPDYVYRLFKKGSLVWDDAIHSLPLTRGTGFELPAQEDLAIVHNHYQTISEYLEQIDRYTNFQAKNLSDKGYLFRWHDLILKPVDEFLNQYFARRGFKCGIHGLALALLQSFSELVLYLKLWQVSGFVETEISSDEVNRQLIKAATDYRWWHYEAKIRNGNFVQALLNKIKRKLGA